MKLPVLHVYGELDVITGLERHQSVRTVVDKNYFEEIVHKGGHYVPQQKEFVQSTIDFIEKTGPIVDGEISGKI